MKTDRWRKIKICPYCKKELKALGYARHMAMHRDQKARMMKQLEEYLNEKPLK